MTRVSWLVVVAGGVLAVCGIGAARTVAPPTPPAVATSCLAPRAPPVYTHRIVRAVSGGSDVWGRQLLATPDGPTYDGARRYVAPLLYATGPEGTAETGSGVYYLPFSFPFSIQDPVNALHVADGSEIISRRVGGRSLTVYVGRAGGEVFGSCLSRLAPARLADGYLPILETSYVDDGGVRYRQESFVGRVHGVPADVSFVRLTVDARRAASGAVVRLVPSTRGLVRVRHALVSDGTTQLLFGRGGTFDGVAVRFIVPRGSRAVLYVDWINRRVRAHGVRADERTYLSGRRLTVRFWTSRLSTRVRYVVPERRIRNAQLGLLAQQLVLGARYSAGNAYEELSYAEVIDEAEVMAEYGQLKTAQAILAETLHRLGERQTNWRAGEQLVADALYFQLVGDKRFVDEQTPELVRLVDDVDRQLASESDHGLLQREPISTDVGDPVYGLHGQAIVRQGLYAMARVWSQTGHAGLAARTRALAARLDASLRWAVRASMVRLPDGSLFVPVALLDEGGSFDRLTASRAGSYWNLVMPYALASGFFAARGATANAVLRYLLNHGSLLLGVVRSKADSLYRGNSPDASGLDNVYGLSESRFLADEDRPDLLVLSLYGMLAAAMTPNTFVAGESSTVTPLDGSYFRTMYLPPNLGSNAAFLETLRLLLVHETRERDGTPRGLELAYATPRAWLAPGKTIRVVRAPTSFGDVSYSLRRRGEVVRVTVDPPARALAELRLRLRLPAGDSVAAIRTAGRAIPYDRERETVDLTGRRGHVVFDVVVRHAGR